MDFSNDELKLFFKKLLKQAKNIKHFWETSMMSELNTCKFRRGNMFNLI